ncbi:MAG: isoprenylcysteine carboxylmethyltransferase family protein [Chitinophagales bacterium]|nr:isoprenylcysteine carboxylmethyltransferase family protein [Chitinophagales bacterium]
MRNKDNLFVITQIILFVVFFLPIADNNNTPIYLNIIGYILLIIGSIIGVMALLRLAESLTIYPSPKQDATLKTDGLYQYMRHPIYTAVILVFLGLTGIFANIFKLAITLIMMVFFYFKSSYEETRLSAHYPDYDAYKKKTGRFLPWF